MRSRVILVPALAALVLVGVLLVPAAYARLSAAQKESPDDEPSRSPAPPTLAEAPVRLDLGADDFLSWALLNRKTGKISGSSNLDETSSTESMIKPWIISDYLRQFGSNKPPTDRLELASAAIRDSDDDATERIFWDAGGEAVITRMIDMCGLTETEAVVPPGERVVWWAYTQMSARDAVRVGECVKSGKAAGPKWTRWILNEMAKVRGTPADEDQHERSGGGRWGIIDGLPQEMLHQGHVGIKNGWTALNADGQWHVNCLAVADDWVLAVMTRYPIPNGLDYGARACASVAAQLVTPQPDLTATTPRPADPSPES